MAAKAESRASDIVSRRGLYFQAFGIYEGIAGFYDYGPIGLRIKKNIEAQWRNIVVRQHGLAGDRRHQGSLGGSAEGKRPRRHVHRLHNHLRDLQHAVTGRTSSLRLTTRRRVWPEELNAVKKLGAEQMEAR